LAASAAVLFILQEQVVGQAWMGLIPVITIVFDWRLYCRVKISMTSNLIFFESLFLNPFMVGAMTVEGFAGLIAIIKW
jgi:hypothetical protein